MKRRLKGAGFERPQRAWIYLAAAGIALSLFAFAIVVGNVVAGARRAADENAWAHLFQLAMAAQVPLLLLFLATADWRRRGRLALLFLAQLTAALAALGALAWSAY